MIPVTDTIMLDDREVNERFVRAAGRAGQSVNRSRPQSSVDIPMSSLPPDLQ